MSDIYYPETLPSPLIGTRFNPVDPQIRTKMESGRTFTRRRFTGTPVDFDIKLLCKTNEQAAEFESFYQHKLKDGTKWFYMILDLPQGKKHYFVQFVGIYKGPKKISPPGAVNGFWEYSASLQMFVRPQSNNS